MSCKLRLMFVTVLPNCLAPLIVQATLGVSSAIWKPPRSASLAWRPAALARMGAMLADSASLQRAPWVVHFRALPFSRPWLPSTCSATGYDALDPKLKRGWGVISYGFGLTRAIWTSGRSVMTQAAACCDTRRTNWPKAPRHQAMSENGHLQRRIACRYTSFGCAMLPPYGHFDLISSSHN